MQTFRIIIERGATSYSAYSPDLPGCVAAHKTLRGVKANMKEAIAIHLAAMAEDEIAVEVNLNKALPNPSHKWRGLQLHYQIQF